MNDDQNAQNMQYQPQPMQPVPQPPQPQQPQGQQQPVSYGDATQEDPQAVKQVEDKFIVETAQAMLQDEAANPGSQDADALAWARGVVGQGPQAPVPTPQPQQPQDPASLNIQHDEPQQQPQVVQPTATEQAASPDGHVLYIDRNEAPKAPNQEQSGDNNGNSN